MSTRSKLLPWLLGILAATLLFALLGAYTSFFYIGTDDAPILRSFMGYEGGVPASFNICIHTFLAWLLHGLALIAPGIAWYSIYQLVLLWFSCVVLVKSAVCCARRSRLPLWAGAVAGTLFLFVYTAFIACRLSFTTTSALAGAAGVAQLFSIDYPKGKAGTVLRGMLLSIGLLLCCYSLRQIGAVPPLVFWAGALLLVWLTYYKPAATKATPGVQQPAPPLAGLKPFLLGILICALSFGVFAGARTIEIKARGLEEHLAWQNARSRLFDYTEFGSNTSQEVLDALGWSQEKLTLVANWYFLDPDITIEAFDALYAGQPAATRTPADRMAALPTTVRGFFQNHPVWGHGCLLMLALALVSITAQAFVKGHSPWLWLAAVGGALAGAALLLFLAYQGRLPLRAGVSVLLPAAAYLLCLALWSLSPPQGAGPTRRALVAVLSAGCLVLAGLGLWQNAQDLYIEPDPDREALSTMYPDLDEYALMDPDILFIHDLSLIGDSRLFPDTSEGIPGNIMFWGGFNARSPSWNHQLKTHGIDPDAFSPEVFLREDVIVAGTDGSPWNSLLAHVRQSTGQEVDWYFHGEYGYDYFYDLYTYE